MNVTVFFEGLTGLKVLSVAFNNISKLKPIDKLTKLQMVYIRGNPIDDFYALDKSFRFKWCGL